MIYSIETDRCTICPKSAPLERDNRCYPCGNNSYYYNLNNTCLPCWQNSLYNQTSGKCDCLDGYHFNRTTGACTTCPATQLYNATVDKCQGCGYNQMLYQGKCYYCPNDTYYDASRHICMKCHPGYVLNQTNRTCVSKCTGGSYYISTTDSCKCPDDKIHWDGVECYSCDLPRYWNDANQACV